MLNDKIYFAVGLCFTSVLNLINQTWIKLGSL